MNHKTADGTGCCERCHESQSFRDCDDCPCHSPQEKDWVRELGWKHKEACADGRSCVCEIGYIQELLSQHEAQVRARYNELIMAVESKHEGETRHQTALRYIQRAEQGNGQVLTSTKKE